MSDIVINSQDLRTSATRLRNLKRDAEQVYYDIQNVYRSHSFVASDLKSALKYDEITRIASIASALEYVASEFESAESDIQKYQYGLDSSSAVPKYFTVSEDHIEKSGSANKISVKRISYSESSPDGSKKKDYVETELSVGLNAGKYKNDDAISDAVFNRKFGDDDWEMHSDELDDNGKVQNPWDKKHATILEVETKASIEKNAYRQDVSGEYGVASGSANVKIGNAEAHSSFSGGFYVYDVDENGNTVKKFSPGVQAEVGGSVSLFEANAEGKVGWDYLNVHGQGTIKAASAEASGSLSVTPSDVHVKLAAEADVVKAEGKVGVNVAGVEGNVTGSVKIGAGAHLDVGYHNGTLKFDMGAALGIGFDLGFEINCSGAVNAVADVGKSIYNTGKKVVEDIGSGIKNFFGW